MVCFDADPNCLYTIMVEDNSLGNGLSYVHYIINNVKYIIAQTL